LVNRKHKQQKQSKAKAKAKGKGNDARRRLPGTMEGRTGAVAIGGNPAQIPIEEATPRIMRPKLTRAKYQ
jgi:hypothetical protein